MRSRLASLAGVVSALSCLVVAAAPLSAAETGSVSGVLLTTDGVPLPQVVLKLTSAQGTRSIVTGSEGRFRITGLTSGEYSLSAEAPGLRLTGSATVVVAAGQEVSLAPALPPGGPRAPARRAAPPRRCGAPA